MTLSIRTRVQIINQLVEGSSMRATARLVDVDRETVGNLGFGIGLACMAIHDQLVTGVPATLIECDEIWGFIFKKDKCKLETDPASYGDAYTFFAIDPDTKLVISYFTGKRELEDASTFMHDLRKRVTGKPQISVDGWPHWTEAVRRSFGWLGCHLGTTLKEYQSQSDPALHCPRNRVKSMARKVIYGSPDEDLISTSIAERANLTTRMHQRRLTRLTNAFSKKFECLRAAMGLHFAYYNFCRVHDTIHTTPAVKAGLTEKPWTLEDLVTAAYEAAGVAPNDDEDSDDWDEDED